MFSINHEELQGLRDRLKNMKEGLEELRSHEDDGGELQGILDEKEKDIDSLESKINSYEHQDTMNRAEEERSHLQKVLFSSAVGEGVEYQAISTKEYVDENEIKLKIAQYELAILGMQREYAETNQSTICFNPDDGILADAELEVVRCELMQDVEYRSLENQIQDNLTQANFSHVYEYSEEKRRTALFQLRSQQYEIQKAKANEMQYALAYEKITWQLEVHEFHRVEDLAQERQDYKDAQELYGDVDKKDNEQDALRAFESSEKTRLTILLGVAREHKLTYAQNYIERENAQIEDNVEGPIKYFVNLLPEDDDIIIAGNKLVVIAHQILEIDKSDETKEALRDVFITAADAVRSDDIGKLRRIKLRAAIRKSIAGMRHANAGLKQNLKNDWKSFVKCLRDFRKRLNKKKSHDRKFFSFRRNGEVEEKHPDRAAKHPAGSMPGVGNRWM